MRSHLDWCQWPILIKTSIIQSSLAIVEGMSGWVSLYTGVQLIIMVEEELHFPLWRLFIFFKRWTIYKICHAAMQYTCSMSNLNTTGDMVWVRSVLWRCLPPFPSWIQLWLAPTVPLARTLVSILELLTVKCVRCWNGSRPFLFTLYYKGLVKRYFCVSVFRSIKHKWNVYWVTVSEKQVKQ